MAVLSYYNYLVFLLLMFLSPILLFLFNRRKGTTSSSSRILPGPYSWPIIGNILIFYLARKKPHIALAKLAQTYGPLFSLRLGTKQMVVASSPEVTREIFKTNDLAVSGRYVPQLANIIPQVYNSVMAMSAQCDERWKFLRSTAHAELFSSQALASHFQFRVGNAKRMLDFLASKDGDVVNIAEVVFATTSNYLTNAMVSQDIITCWDNIGEMKNHTRRLIALGIPRIADLYPAIGGLDFWRKQKAVDYNNINAVLWGDIVRKRRGTKDVGNSSRDFLDVLIKNSLDDHQIYNFLTEMFISSETLSTAIEWTMAELTRNQGTLSKLRDELKEAIEGSILSESKLSKLPYLQSCIKEALRLHPPNPVLVPRCVLQTCKIMNYEIPKNSLLLLNGYALGRDPKIWEDPHSFKPERFLDKNLDIKGTNYELLPFGAGRRICAGLPLALKQMQLILASLVYPFDWSLPFGLDPANLDMSEKFGLTLSRENPLLLIPKVKNILQINV